MDNWSSFTIYCPNCGTLLSGVKDKNGKVRYRCRKCGIEMTRTSKGRRHDTLEVYAPHDK